MYRKIPHKTLVNSEIPKDRRLLAKSVNCSLYTTNYLQFKKVNTYFLTKILELLSYLLQQHQDFTKGQSAIAPIQRFVVSIKAFFRYSGLA